MLNSHQSEMCASKGRTTIHPNGAIFFLYSYQNKTLYNESIHEK